MSSLLLKKAFLIRTYDEEESSSNEKEADNVYLQTCTFMYVAWRI